jgi:hypothetical protein
MALELTEQQIAVLAFMADERLASIEQQAQQLLDQKATAEGQLNGLKQYLSPEAAAAVEAAIATDLKG